MAMCPSPRSRSISPQRGCSKTWSAGAGGFESGTGPHLLYLPNGPGTQDHDAAKATRGSNVDSLTRAVADQGRRQRAVVRDPAAGDVTIFSTDDRELGLAVLVAQPYAGPDAYARFGEHGETMNPVRRRKLHVCSPLHRHIPDLTDQLWLRVAATVGCPTAGLGGRPVTRRISASSSDSSDSNALASASSLGRLLASSRCASVRHSSTIRLISASIRAPVVSLNCF